MKLPAVASALTASLVAATLAACPAGDICNRTPFCQDTEDNRPQTVNCEPSCQSPGCSNGAQFHVCAEGTTCRVVGSVGSSQIAFRDRAVCEVSSDSCDPSIAPAPTCNGLGTINGCSEYRVVIEAACDQAQLFFRDFSCCSQPLGDGGQSNDGGEDGGG